jgi:hypothetical protein
MRPQSIILFERIVLATIALGIVASVLNWQRTVASIQAVGFGPGFIIAIQAVSVAVMLLLLYFIARRASEVAKWIFIVLVVLGALNLLVSFKAVLAMGPGGMISPFQIVLQLVAIWLLFRPDSLEWFAKDRG